MGIALDITEQKQASEKLRESEKRFRDLTEMLPEAVFESDRNVNLIYANQQAFRFFCYTKQDFDKGLNGIDLLIPEDRKRAEDNLVKRFQGKEIGINEYEALRKDGSTFPVLLHAIPIFGRGWTIKGLRGIIKDMTDRKQAEEELNKYRNHLEELVADRTSIFSAQLLRVSSGKVKPDAESEHLRWWQERLTLTTDSTIHVWDRICNKIISIDYNSIMIRI